MSFYCTKLNFFLEIYSVNFYASYVYYTNCKNAYDCINLELRCSENNFVRLFGFKRIYPCVC